MKMPLVYPTTIIPTEDDMFDGGVNILYLENDLFRMSFCKPSHPLFCWTIETLRSARDWEKIRKVYGWFPDERSPNGKLWLSQWFETPTLHEPKTQQKIETTKRKIRIEDDAVRSEDEVKLDVREAYEH